MLGGAAEEAFDVGAFLGFRPVTGLAPVVEEKPVGIPVSCGSIPEVQPESLPGPGWYSMSSS